MAELAKNMSARLEESNQRGNYLRAVRTDNFIGYASGLTKHPLPQRVMHWFNASSFLFLWLTGLAIVSSAEYRIVPDVYIQFMLSIFGSVTTLMNVHITVGIIWFSTLVLGFLIDPWGLGLRFLKDLRLTSRDFKWLKLRGKHELHPDEVELPPQGAYNAGQKMFGFTVLAGSAAIGLTGIVMLLGPPGSDATSWAVFLHLVAVGGVIAFFFVHFTMTVLLKEERQSLPSMLTGKLPTEYAKHHHEDWFDQVKERGGEEVDVHERFGIPRATGRLLRRTWEWVRARPERIPGSPYAAGVGLGLVVLVAFLFLGHGVGASGLFSRLGANTVALVSPDLIWSNSYWGPTLAKGIADYWLLWLVLGMAIGGFVSAFLAGHIKPGIDRGTLISPSTRILLAFTGGAIVGFATRFTRGCTSHQALSGGALLSVGSWVFVLSVFAGGFLTAFLLRRVWR